MAFNVTSGTADLYLIDLWRTSSIKANSGDGLTGTLISIRPTPADLGMVIVPGLCIIFQAGGKIRRWKIRQFILKKTPPLSMQG